MRRLFQAALVLVFFMQAASVSADMVVFFHAAIVDRSTLRVNVGALPSGQILVHFFWGGVFMGAEPQFQNMKFLCNEQFGDKMKETVDVILQTLDKDKYINPYDIFKKAGLTGCKVLK